MELVCDTWKVTPLEVEHVESSFFEDRSTFPDETLAFDSALLMRGISHQWQSRKDLCCAPGVGRNNVV